MKSFIKSVSPDDPIMKPIMDEFGFDGYGRFIAVLDFCRKFQIETLDIQLIVNQARSNKRGAAKLLPLFQECLTKVLQKFGESFSKVSPNFDQSLPKLEAQNPRGRNKSITREEENREEKKEDLLRPKPLRVTDEQLQTAKWIFEQIRAMNPSQKEPNFQGWANDVRLMVEQDGRSLEAIKELFSWVTKDQFWRTNVLSPAKLREKWDMLTLKKQNPGPSYVQKPKGTYLPGNQIVPASQRTGLSLQGAELKAELARIRAEHGGGNV